METQNIEEIIARMLARAEDRWHMGGFLCFGPDGSGGQWYSEGSRVGDGYACVPMRCQRGPDRRAAVVDALRDVGLPVQD